MQGEPIPGEHWVTIDLLDSYVIRKVVIDWEQAYSDQWTLLVSLFQLSIFALCDIIISLLTRVETVSMINGKPLPLEWMHLLLKEIKCI